MMAGISHMDPLAGHAQHVLRRDPVGVWARSVTSETDGVDDEDPDLNQPDDIYMPQPGDI